MYLFFTLLFLFKLKTWLRSTLGEERLNGQCLLHIGKYVKTDIIILENIIICFGKQKKQTHAFISIILNYNYFDITVHFIIYLLTHENKHIFILYYLLNNTTCFRFLKSRSPWKNFHFLSPLYISIITTTNMVYISLRLGHAMIGNCS